jgi:radical SAM protein with 4Fe4S-binding SPASM domain
MKDLFHDIYNSNLLEECPPSVKIDDWKKFRKKYKEASEFKYLDSPAQIDIELNAGCNMKCPFCLHGYTKRKNTLLSYETYKSIIDEAVKFGIRGLKLNYINEPMLRSDLEDFIKYAKNAGILNIYMTTNGTLLNEKRYDSILKSGITKIFISVDAVTSETYNKQRLSGKFDTVVKNILGFIEERNSRGKKWPLIRVSFLKNALNEHEAEKFHEAWKNKVDLIAYQKMNELPDRESGIILKEENDKIKTCTFPFKQLVIDHEGDILPCCTMGGKKLSLGNIKNTTLKEAWTSDAMLELKKLHKEKRGHENPICNRCLNS